VTVVRDGRALRCLWGICGLITVGNKYRYESGSGLGIYLSGVGAHNGS
jgi:hypothetical protein